MSRESRSIRPYARLSLGDLNRLRLLSDRGIHCMASLLSLPDEIIDIIGTVTERHVGIKAWCMLTSTCRRLWRLQLPQSRRGWAIPTELNIEGMLHRLLSCKRQYSQQLHKCCSMRPCPSSADQRHHINVWLRLQGWPGYCSACKQHPGYNSSWITWDPSGPLIMQSFLPQNLSTACKSIWR